MIRIERSSVKKPARLDRACEPALAELRDFFAQKDSVKGQRTLRFKTPHVDILKRPLLELFHSKCAFCETRVDASSIHIDPFRPKINAIRSNSAEPVRDRYWWLLYEWTNNYAACFTCNRHKGSFFPLRGRRAAKPETKGPELDAVEHRLLLDPCADEPSASLVFDRDGSVRGLDERGKVTIDILGLNRSGLVEARAAALEAVFELLAWYAELDDRPREAMNTAERAAYDELRHRLLAETADDAEYAAAKRQFVEPALGILPDERRAPAPRASSRTDETDGDRSGWGEYGSIWIDRIEIENFKAIKHLEIEFPEPSADYDSEIAELFSDLGREMPSADDSTSRSPWIMLLGENGIGKSSILKATALAFMDDETAQLRLGAPADVVNREARSGRGCVKIHFNRSDTPLVVEFSRNSPHYERNYYPPPIPVIAYGATRLPPLPDEPHHRRSKLEVANLFDPRAGLSDPERHFADPERVDSKKFNAFARSLKLLLNLDDEVQISRRNGEIRIKTHPLRPPIPLRDNSDGYRSIAALATDIMEKLATDWLNMESAEGTVILDELEAHLHPSWKIEIVNRLRSVFPKVRFIVTTHDPLCLHGTRRGELLRLDRDEETGHVRCVPIDFDEGMRADQLLTGEWFGLASTLDRDTLALMAEHAKLIAKRRPSAKDEQLKIRVEAMLGDRLDAGYAETPAQRIAIAATREVVTQRTQTTAPTMSKSDIGSRVRAMTRAKRRSR